MQRLAYRVMRTVSTPDGDRDELVRICSTHEAAYAKTLELEAQGYTAWINIR